MHTPIHDLKTKGFVVLSYPAALRREVDKTVALWKEFCALPDKVKKGLPYSNASDGVGYELKEGVGTHADRKENFDVATGGREWLETHATEITDAAALAFVKEAAVLAERVKPVIMDFAKHVEAAFGVTGLLREVEESESQFFIRFIHYFGQRKLGDVTAMPHADQSGFTLHLFESAAGLQCLSFGGEWTDMPVSDGETVIIPAMQLQLRSQGELKALCHRVVATKKTQNQGRFSAVCFIQLKHTPKYEKETHGRLQEKEPGFNYSLPYGELSRLFKK